MFLDQYPRGIIGLVTMTGSSFVTLSTTATRVTGSPAAPALSVSLPGRRRLRLTCSGATSTNVAATTAEVRLYIGDVAKQSAFVLHSSVSGPRSFYLEYIFTTAPEAGTYDINMRLRRPAGIGEVTALASSLQPWQLAVEDLGPGA